MHVRIVTSNVNCATEIVVDVVVAVAVALTQPCTQRLRRRSLGLSVDRGARTSWACTSAYSRTERTTNRARTFVSQYLPQLCSCVLSSASGLDLSLLYAMLREKGRLSSGTFGIGVRSVLCSYLSWKWSGPGGSVKNQILLVLLSSPSSSTPPPPFSFHVHITVSLSYGSLSLCR